MNLQLKFIVLAFSAFTFVSAASAPVDPSNDELGLGSNVRAAKGDSLSDKERAEFLRKFECEKEIEKEDCAHMSDLKRELVEVAVSARKVGLDGFAREFRRGFNCVFSDTNMKRTSDLLTRVRDEVPVKFLVASGLLITDSILTGFIFDKPSQAIVVSGLACYAWMSLPDFSYYTNYVSKSVSNLVTQGISAGCSAFFNPKK